MENSSVSYDCIYKESRKFSFGDLTPGETEQRYNYDAHLLAAHNATFLSLSLYQRAKLKRHLKATEPRILAELLASIKLASDVVL